MIEFQAKAAPPAAFSPLPTVFANSFDEQEAMIEHLERLVSLIDDTLPVASTVAELERAETIAAKIIRHLTLYEGAWFSRRRVNGWLYGLSLGGVSTSSSTCRFILLRNWQRAARSRLGAMSW